MYLSPSLCQAQDDHNKAMVGVAGSEAKGFMALSSTVDLPLLQKCFMLEPFDSLMSFDEETGELEEVEGRSLKG